MRSMEGDSVRCCRNCVTTGLPGDPQAALHEFDVLLRRYGALSGADVDESVKAALVQKGIT